MILVTGGAKRLGKAISCELVALGFDVIIHYNTSEKEVKELAKSSSHFDIIQGDFSKPLEPFLERLLKRFPHITGLVNNVGNYSSSSASSLDITALQALLQSNLFSAITLTKGLLPSITKAQGSIVNLGVSGLSHAWQKAVGYGLTKAALLFYTRALARELASCQVNVNMVSPGQIEGSIAPSTAPLPWGREIAEKEVAALVASLFTEKSHAITGQNIEIAGAYQL